MRWLIVAIAGGPIALSIAASACASTGSISPPVTGPSATPTILASATPSTAATAARPPTGESDVGALPTFTFIDGVHGWFALGKTVWATQDGGHRWAAVATMSATVTRLSFTSVNGGWAATVVGLQQTDDGGKIWRLTPTGDSGRPVWVQLVDSQHGWITILGGVHPGGVYQYTLRSTADAGQSWHDVTLPCPPPPNVGTHFSFVSPDAGFALCVGQPGAGAQGKSLYRTVDGAETWQLIESVGVPGGGSTPYPSRWLPQAGYATDLFFVDKTHGWISLNRVGVAATEDGGVSWDYGKLYDEPFPQGGVVFATTLRGWVLIYPSGVGGQLGDVPSLLGTDDGGLTWTLSCADVRSCD